MMNELGWHLSPFDHPYDLFYQYGTMVVKKCECYNILLINYSFYENKKSTIGTLCCTSKEMRCDENNLATRDNRWGGEDVYEKINNSLSS